jgi:hypothetical protein
LPSQLGVQQSQPVALFTQVWPGTQALQIPPQPSEAPQPLFAQEGVHFGAGGAGAGGDEPNRVQESTHFPFWQIAPSVQVTFAQGFATHVPSAQSWPSGQLTPLQRSGAQATRLHSWPSGQLALQGTSGRHFPSAREQNWPGPQATPLHGCGKQPLTQWPSTQVSPLAQLMPLHASNIGTHAGWQEPPPAQSPEAMQTGALQIPWKQILPPGQ